MKSCASLEQQYVIIDSIHTIFYAVVLKIHEKIRGPPVRVVPQQQQAVNILKRTDPTVLCPSRVVAGGTQCPKILVDLPTILFLLSRGVGHGGCSISQKNTDLPPLRNRLPCSSDGRGVEVLEPPPIMRGTEFFMHMYTGMIG